MTKRHNSLSCPGGTDTLPVLITANTLLAEIAILTEHIDHLTDEAYSKVKEIEDAYEGRLAALKEDWKAKEKELISLMKKRKGVIFDGGDLVRLVNGTLIRETGEKVTIPRDALGKCEALGFNDVIKIAKSLDREAVKKWTNERLFLIGAERKLIEEFKYDLKKDTKC